MLFDAPACMKTIKVCILRTIPLTKANYEAAAKALGLDVKKKNVLPTTIYIVQESPEVEGKS